MEKYIAASSDRFTIADFDFLNEILGDGQKRASIAKLWDDPDALREMLDLKAVLRAILDSPSALGVSSDFYFYVLVRHAFKRAGIEEADVAEYVSRLLAERLRAQKSNPLQDIAHGYNHAADFLAVISSAKGKMKFHLQVAAGNQFLILTGLFPEFINRRSESHGTPDLQFYESFARRSFQSAVKSCPSGKESGRVLGRLTEAFPDARRSLNKIAGEFLFLGD